MSLSKPVSAIMTSNPVVANKFHNLSQMLRLFTEFPIHHLPIVDANNHLVGIVSTNDLPKIFLSLCNLNEKITLDIDALDKAVNIADIMTANPISVGPNETIENAAKIFAEKKFLALPVVDNGVLIGILSLKDVMNYIVERVL